LLRCNCESKLKEHSTIDKEELKNHHLDLKIIEEDLNFTEVVVEEEEDMDDDE
jgi:hypothetical protein